MHSEIHIPNESCFYLITIASLWADIPFYTAARVVVGLSIVCECGISWSYSLTFLTYKIYTKYTTYRRCQVILKYIIYLQVMTMKKSWYSVKFVQQHKHMHLLFTDVHTCIYKKQIINVSHTKKETEEKC